MPHLTHFYSRKLGRHITFAVPWRGQALIANQWNESTVPFYASHHKHRLIGMYEGNLNRARIKTTRKELTLPNGTRLIRTESSRRSRRNGEKYRAEAFWEPSRGSRVGQPSRAEEVGVKRHRDDDRCPGGQSREAHWPGRGEPHSRPPEAIAAAGSCWLLAAGCWLMLVGGMPHTGCWCPRKLMMKAIQRLAKHQKLDFPPLAFHVSSPRGAERYQSQAQDTGPNLA